VRISGIFRESRDILGAYLGFLQNYSWQLGNAAKKEFEAKRK
jgi:hypothetical protein